MAATPIPQPKIERRRGFTPLPNEVLWDWSRLCSGDAQVFSILFINSELHVPRDKGAPALEWTRGIAWEELAGFARCTIRALQIAVADLVKRRVLLQKTAKGGGFSYGIPFDTWPSLPDRPSKVIEISEVAEEAAEEPQDERPKGEVFQVFTKPQRVKPGSRTRAKELPRAAGKLQVEAESLIEFDARMCDGNLIIRVKSEQPAKQQRTTGERIGNVFRDNKAQPVETTPAEISEQLHSLLDGYCWKVHSSVPGPILIAKIARALGRAPVAVFRRVLQAKIKLGKSIPIGLFVNLAEDAARGFEAKLETLEIVGCRTCGKYSDQPQCPRCGSDLSGERAAIARRRAEADAS
jgi:hypothetical protein